MILIPLRGQRYSEYYKSEKRRTSLKGLDNIAAGGAEAFDNMHKKVDDLKLR